MPWRRPGFQLGLDIAAIKSENPQAIGCILGGHGVTAWGDTSEESEANSLWIIDTAAAYIAEHTKAEPFGPALEGYARAARGRAAGPGGRPGADAALDRLARQADGRPLHRLRRGAGLPGRRRAPAAGRARHQLPGPLPAHQGQAAGARPAADRHRGGVDRPAARAARGVPGRLPGLLRPQRHARLAGHPRRRPVDHPHPRRRACSPTARTSRPPGWPGSSTSTRST